MVPFLEEATKHVIIDTEDQNWRSDEGVTSTDDELVDDNKRFYQIDWIRFYKHVSNH